MKWRHGGQKLANIMFLVGTIPNLRYVSPSIDIGISPAGLNFAGLLAKFHFQKVSSYSKQKFKLVAMIIRLVRHI